MRGRGYSRVWATATQGDNGDESTSGAEGSATGKSRGVQRGGSVIIWRSSAGREGG